MGQELTMHGSAANPHLLRIAIPSATLMAMCVIVLGAYVRLSDAGLACPDWPGCYGRLHVPYTPEQQQAASLAFPDSPLDVGKAWIEMTHRYLAGALGLLVLAIFILTRRPGGAPLRGPATLLLAVVILQALLGMWTVTQQLKPITVTAHLLGGMATLGLLTWLALKQRSLAGVAKSLSLPGMRLWANAALVVLAMQITLGGWTSSHYAGLACGEFPRCQGAWLPVMDFARAFAITGEANGTSGEPRSAALTAIHWSHRLGALVTAIVLLGFAIAMLRLESLRSLGRVIALLVLLQVGAGIGNVLLDLPTALAVAHNAMAALLVAAMVAARFVLRSRS